MAVLVATSFMSSPPFAKTKRSKDDPRSIWARLESLLESFLKYDSQRVKSDSEGFVAVAKIKARIESRFECLRRLSVVFASQLRIKIVTELYLREMSPKQFHAEFGGGSMSRVDKTFKKLAEHGWLRYIHSKGPGGSRRGATEHFYRATELAVIDEETWALVPYSMRTSISWTIFKVFAERVRHALDAKTLTARAGSHLGSTTIALDQPGWERVAAAANTLFESIFEEQDDVKIRVQGSNEKPMLATVGLVVFESPVSRVESDHERSTPLLAEVEKECPVPFPLRVSKAFADELCLKIIEEANRREISVLQFHAEFGGDTVGGIRRRFKKMEGAGWLKRVGKQTGGRRRSAVEYFYRATGPAIFAEEGWAVLPSSVKPLPAAWTTFMQLAQEVKEAILAGTFEARLDNHFTWSLLRLDREGWQKLSAAVDELLSLILKEWEAAERRMAHSGEKAITTTIALALFESPKTAIKEP
jgi:hypothetical protein